MGERHERTRRRVVVAKFDNFAQVCGFEPWRQLRALVNAAEYVTLQSYLETSSLVFMSCQGHYECVVWCYSLWALYMFKISLTRALCASLWKKRSKTKEGLFTSVQVSSECHVSALKLQVQVQVLKLVCGAENISFSSWADLKSTLKSAIEASGERGLLLSLLHRLSDLLLWIAPSMTTYKITWNTIQ